MFMQKRTNLDGPKWEKDGKMDENRNNLGAAFLHRKKNQFNLAKNVCENETLI